MKSISSVYPSRALTGMAGIVTRGLVVAFALAIVYASPLFFQRFQSSLGVNVAEAAQAVDVWWPADAKVVSGVQPFKAMLQERSVENYDIYWQVDGGQWNGMYSSYQDYPHKEVSVDLTNWKWRGTGPYVLTFIATEHNKTVISQKNVTIYTGTPTAAAQPTSPVVITTTSTAPVAPAPAPATPAPTPAVTTATNPAPAVPSGTNPLAGQKLYVDPNNPAKKEAERVRSLASLLEKISDSAQSRWFGGWNSDIKGDAEKYVTSAANAGALPVLVAYNIPDRDCSGYSAGGASSADAYRSWIRGLADGIGNRKAIVVLEPDALALNTCLSASAQEDRYALLKEAVGILKAKGGISVYLDAGHANWIGEADMAARLGKAGVAESDGFALNVSNYETTAANASYGEKISSLVGGKHFVIDTSRNGRGPNGEWCNPWNRGLGDKPTTATGRSLVDAFLWIKTPGESDGTCNGGPSAGAWWLDYAINLAKNAIF